MVGHGSCQFDSEQSVELFGEVGNELWAPIRHHLLRESMMSPNVLDKESSSPCCGDRSEGRGKVGPFGDQINHHHDCIVAGRLWELTNEVYADCVPGGDQDQERVKFTDQVRPS